MIDGCEKKLAEQVLGDSSLIDDLDDRLAQPLLDWGLSASRAFCHQVEHMEMKVAEAYLDSAIVNLRRVMRRINNLIGQFIEMDEATAQVQVERVLDAARDVAGVQINMLGGDTALLTHTLQIQGSAGAMTLLLEQVLQIKEGMRPSIDEIEVPDEPEAEVPQAPPAERPGRARPPARAVPPTTPEQDTVSQNDDDSEEGNSNASPRRRLPF